MPNTNDFVPFATGVGALTYSPAIYQDLPVVDTGFQNGIADPATFNTAARQASSIATMIAQFMADFGSGNVQDNGNISALENQFEAALLSYIFAAGLPGAAVHYGAAAGGSTANALVASFTPALPGSAASVAALPDGMLFLVTPSLANTSSTGYTIAPNGLPPAALKYPDNTNPFVGEIQNGYPFIAMKLGAQFIYKSPRVGARSASASMSTSTPLSLSNNVATAFSLGSVTAPFGSSTGTTFTFSRAGLFSISATMAFAMVSSANTITNTLLFIEQNGVTPPGMQGEDSTNVNGTFTGLAVSASAVITVAAGDTIQCFGLCFLNTNFTSAFIDNVALKITQLS